MFIAIFFNSIVNINKKLEIKKYLTDFFQLKLKIMIKKPEIIFRLNFKY